MRAIISILDKFSPFTRRVSLVSKVALVAMVCFIFADVVLRYVFNRPIAGSPEIIELLMVFAVFCAIAYCQSVKGHVAMDIVTGRLRSKQRVVMDGITYFLSMVVFILLIWQTSMKAIQTSEVTFVLRIPVSPFAALVPFGCTLLLLQLLRQFLINIVDGIRLQFGGKLWFLMFGIPVLVLIGFAVLLAAAPLEMSKPLIGVIGFIIMFLLFATGMPIGFVLMGASVVFLSCLRGTLPAFDMFGTSWYRTAAHYEWSPLMLFIFMGFVCFRAGLGADLFNAAYKWIGHLRGGLAMSCVGACTAFGAVVGDTIAGSVTMTTVALPEMRKYKYNDELSIGTLACAGTIGTLIPPSIGFIIYAVLSEQSIGELFIAGIFPGLICATFFMSMIYGRCWLNPGLGPPAKRSSWRPRLVSLKSAGPIGVLFLLVIGGIYAGIFTPSEGGGIGAFGALVIALLMRRLTWTRFTEAMDETARFTGMGFTILGGAIMFGYFMAISNIPYAMTGFVEGLAVHPMIVMLAIIIVLFILGCFLPYLPVMLICIPIFVPVAIAMGWDLVWFGVIMVLMFNMAAITPPFGINLFIIRGVTGIPITLMYRSAIPFVLVLLVVVAIIVAFPALSTWLPYLLRG